MTGDELGETSWTLPGGYVPADSTGPEPEMVSHEALCLLNATAEMATLEIELLYENGREAGPYVLTLAPERMRRVRINGLIDPYAPPLGRNYGISVKSDVPIVVQFERQDTRQRENASFSTIAYGE